MHLSLMLGHCYLNTYRMGTVQRMLPIWWKRLMRKIHMLQHVVTKGNTGTQKYECSFFPGTVQWRTWGQCGLENFGE